MKLTNKKTLTIGLTILIITFLGLYIFKTLDSFKELSRINPIYIAIIIPLVVLYFYTNGLFLKIFTDPFNIKLKEHFLLSITTSFYNLIAPLKAGMGVRAIYLKKKHNLKYSDFIISFFGTNVLIILINSLGALIIFSIIFFKTNTYNIYAYLIFICLTLTCFFIIFYKRTFKNKNKIFQTLNKLIIGWQKIVKHPKLLIQASLLTTINIFITSIINFLIFKSLNQEISLIQSMYFSVMATLSLFINITPGSIGILEGLYIISGKILNIQPEIALLVALIFRLLFSIVILSLGPIANTILMKKITIKTKNTNTSTPS